MDLILHGAVPTFLLERVATATGAEIVEPLPPRQVRLGNAVRTAAFEELLPLLAAENLQWTWSSPGEGVT